MKLYDYIRSSAAYRVRIALNLKGVDCESIPVSLLDGDQKSSEYLDVNSAGLVPALETQGNIITQSLPSSSTLMNSTQSFHFYLSTRLKEHNAAHWLTMLPATFTR